MAFRGLFFGAQCFDFNLRLIGGASAFHRVRGSLSLEVTDHGKRYCVSKVAALARAKQAARHTHHGEVEQQTDGAGAVATERGGDFVHLLEPGRWQTYSNHRVVARARATEFSAAFSHAFLLTHSDLRGNFFEPRT